MLIWNSDDSVDAPNCAAGTIRCRILRIFDNRERERMEREIEGGREGDYNKYKLESKAKDAVGREEIQEQA